jgi:hypothetical protein
VDVPRPDEYINYGTVTESGPLDILRLRADTWYYDEGDRFGTMALGPGPVDTSAGATAFVGEQLRAFFRAGGDVFRPAGESELTYIPREEYLRGSPSYSCLRFPSARFAELLPARLPPDSLIAGVGVPMNLRGALRTFEDGLEWRWLAAGKLHLGANLISWGVERRALVESPRWRAVPWVDILSVFRPDNAAILAGARARWRRLRAADPRATAFPVGDDGGEEEPYAGLIALADPPSGTPGDNRALAALNAPALREAVARWEEAVGHPFDWEDALDG